MISTLIFDLGGVVITLDPHQAARRFEALGLRDAASHLNSYTQHGIFGDLESGHIDADTFRRELSRMVGHDVSHADCAHAWQGYARDVPQRNLDCLRRLRAGGYRLILLSNTNPFMMEWVGSSRFDGRGHDVSHYFDALYLSYRMGVMKPAPEIFQRMLDAEGLRPDDCLFLDDGEHNVAAAARLGIHTLCPQNGADWTVPLYRLLSPETPLTP